MCWLKVTESQPLQECRTRLNLAQMCVLILLERSGIRTSAVCSLYGAFAPLMQTLLASSLASSSPEGLEARTLLQCFAAVPSFHKDLIQQA